MAKVRIKLGEMNALALCTYTAVASVVNGAFGGGGSAPVEERNDLAQAPTFEMALLNINQALNFG